MRRLALAAATATAIAGGCRCPSGSSTSLRLTVEWDSSVTVSQIRFSGSIPNCVDLFPSGQDTFPSDAGAALASPSEALFYLPSCVVGQSVQVDASGLEGGVAVASGSESVTLAAGETDLTISIAG